MVGTRWVDARKEGGWKTLAFWTRIWFLPPVRASRVWSASRYRLSRLTPIIRDNTWRVLQRFGSLPAPARRGSMHSRDHCLDSCFQGSTEFYDGPQTDEFTPSLLEAGLLAESVGQRRDGTPVPWMVEGSNKSPIEQYVEWFNGIWHTGDPNTWSASVFTNLAVMIDPTGISTGAKQAAASFVLLFKYFPELRGEVVSWAANDREIFINWRFEILPKGSKTPLLVPVVDKFCFVDGRVSFRLAYFDILTLLSYLAENFGENRLVDFLAENSQQAVKTGGIQRLPGILLRVIRGLFVWQSADDPTGLSAAPGDGVVMLNWKPVKDAISYKVNRATAVAGPYEVIETVSGIRYSYDDRSVMNGTLYWYFVTPSFAKWKPTPSYVKLSESTSEAIGRAQRRAAHGGSL